MVAWLWMPLTLDFQGQILKKSKLRNGMSDCQETKRMWVDRMLIGSIFWLSTLDFIHDIDLEFSTSNFEIDVSQEWEG